MHPLTHAVAPIRGWIGILVLLVARPVAAAEPPPDPAEVVAAMKKATAFFTEKLAVHGGYASAWKRDLSGGETEHKQSKTVISIQPPGTTTVGLALVKAYLATGDGQFLEAARAAGRALAECQLASGGWDSDFDFAEDQAKKYWLRRQLVAGDASRGKRRSTSTLDDNKTQSALLLLLELSHLPECRGDAALRESLAFGLDRLLAAQLPNGGWPQQYDGPADPATPVTPATYPRQWPRRWPATSYHGFATLNDGNLDHAVRLMLRAHEITGEDRFLASAKKVGDFLILAQMPEPQRAWAQQYDRDMQPAWARKFEPPAVTGGESLGAMQTLHELYVATGDETYLKPLPAAFAWYDRSALPDGRYARFYELRTNKPLYFVKDTYELTYDDSKLPTHYAFKLDHIARTLDTLRRLVKEPREKLLQSRAAPQTEKAWTSSAKGAMDKVAKALASRTADGVWLKDGKIDAGEFTRHMNAMAGYVEGANRGGTEFEKFRAAKK